MTRPAPSIARWLCLATAAACAAPRAPRRFEARPAAGDPDARPAAGQTPCEAATRPWPAVPASVERRIEAQMRDGRLPGLAACLVVDGDIAWCGGFGTTEGGGGEPVTPDTPFLLASVSKLVTATAVGRLAADGALDLDDDIDAIVPFRVEHPRSDAPITLRRALAHAGGVDDNGRVMDRYYADDRDPRRALLDVTEAYFDPSGADHHPKANFTPAGPGRVSRYSNMGYALLGAAVEAHTGVDFADWTERELLHPLGLTHTAWRLADHDFSTLAEPTSHRNGEWKGHGHYTFADYPNGGLRSSARDTACLLAAFARGGSLYGQTVLPAEDLYGMMASAYPGLDPYQGLGWGYSYMGGGPPWVGHSGGEAGVATDAYLQQDGALGIVVLTNGDWRTGREIEEIERVLIGWGREMGG